MHRLRNRLITIAMLALPFIVPSVFAETQPATVTIDRTTYFTAPDGGAVLMEPGEYELAPIEESLIRFTSVGQPAVTVQASIVEHDLSVTGQFAFTIVPGEDEVHAVLLLPEGKARDAVGSYSGVRSRATNISTLSPQLIQQAALVQPRIGQSIPNLRDPCLNAGSTSSTASSLNSQLVVPLNQSFVGSTLLDPGAGAGPIADVTDWQPRVRVPAGAMLTIRGRNLDPARLIARIGNTTLTKVGPQFTGKGGSLVGEVRFYAPAVASTAGKPLVVYHEGGQARSLEPGYLVFNPTILITRLVPSTFGQGDLVTVCGQSLFHANTAGPLANPIPNSSKPIGPGNLLQTSTEHFGLIGDKLVHMINPMVSPSGDRMTFIAGSLHRTQGHAVEGQNSSAVFYIVPIAPQPANLSGAFQLVQSGSANFGGPYVTGPPSTWHLGGPKITKVYADPMRQFGIQEPFIILPTILPNNTVYLGRFPSVHVEGGNLEAQFRIGTLPIASHTILSPDGTKVGLQLPSNAGTAPICGTKNNITGCFPGPFSVVPGPVLANLPSVPLALFTIHTINGLNLLPAGVSGLTYRFTISGLDPANGSPTLQQCNIALSVLEHTAQRIRFRVGDPAGPPPSSACQNLSFFAAGIGAPTMFLTASFADKPPFTLFHQPLHLARPAQ